MMSIRPDSERSSRIAHLAQLSRRDAGRTRMTRAVLGLAFALIVILYIVSMMYSRFGGLTVAVDPYQMEQYALSLCETPDFSAPTSALNARASAHITNISEYDLPADIDHINGLHAGDHYLAYTFYLTNAGDSEVTFEYEVLLQNVTQNLDSALRVRLYEDGEPTTYAKTRSDGGGAEDGCAEFLSSTVIARKQVTAFAPGDIKKYTIVLWLEGNDADCVDALIGGTLKTAMMFSVIDGEESDA